MSAKKTTKKAKKKVAKPAEEKKEPIVVRARVMKNGVSLNGSTCGVGAVVRLYADAANFHEGRGEIEIMGT